MNTLNFTKVRLMAILNELDAREITNTGALGVIDRVEQLLDEYRNTPFVIGKTDDPNRRENEYALKDYSIFKVVFSHPSLDAIDEMEKCLIRYFKIEETTADGIINENDGGAGRRSEGLMYYIYVAIKPNDNEHN